MDIEDTVSSPYKSSKIWFRQFQLIQKMREGIKAPVDILGCDRLADPSEVKTV